MIWAAGAGHISLLVLVMIHGTRLARIGVFRVVGKSAQVYELDQRGWADSGTG